MHRTHLRNAIVSQLRSAAAAALIGRRQRRSLLPRDETLPFGILEIQGKGGPEVEICIAIRYVVEDGTSNRFVRCCDL